MKADPPYADDSAAEQLVQTPAAPDKALAENYYGRFQGNSESIVLDAPRASGVYGLYSATWIFVGEAGDIRARLMEHWAGDNPCITSPTTDQRASRSSSSRGQTDIVATRN